MAKTREIKRRIKAVGNIKRITKTMQMIATARFQAAQKRATAAQPYTRKIAELVGQLAAAAATQSGGSASGGAESNGQPAGGLSHPLLRTPDPRTNRELLLVLTSNRGLAGGYNGSILRLALTYIRAATAEGKTVEVEVVGKKGVNFFKFNNVQVAKFHGEFADQPRYEQVEPLAERYMSEFSAGKYDAVRVVYMSFVSMARQTPRNLQLLPLENPADTEGRGATPGKSEGREAKIVERDAAGIGTARVSEKQGGRTVSVDYDFSPSPAELLGELLPITVKTQLFQCFNEANVSEQIARMVAMKAATDAAGKMGKDLNRRYNRARQAAITTELSEIIAGAASLE
jgi:F-type H+-transporting ATPase subunit gamma